MCMSAQVLDFDEVEEEPLITILDPRSKQHKDPNIGPVIKAVSQGRFLKLNQYIPGTAIYQLVREFNNLKIRRGLLYRDTIHGEQQKLQAVLPTLYKDMVLDSLHDKAGHQGRDRTLSLIQDRFFWPFMYKYVDVYVKSCDRCIKRRAATNTKAPLVNICTYQPLELVCIDYFTLEPSKGGFQNVLVITDHYTRYAQAIPTKHQTARTTAEAFFHGFIVHYEIPMKLHNDQGANFEGKIIHELCDLTGMRKSRTSSCHPEGNGMCERFNQTLIVPHVFLPFI